MVIGGSDIFTRLMPRADRLEITHVHASPDGDPFFRRSIRSMWEQRSGREHRRRPEGLRAFTFATYVRR